MPRPPLCGGLDPAAFVLALGCGVLAAAVAHGNPPHQSSGSLEIGLPAYMGSGDPCGAGRAVINQLQVQLDELQVDMALWSQLPPDRKAAMAPLENVCPELPPILVGGNGVQSDQNTSATAGSPGQTPADDGSAAPRDREGSDPRVRIAAVVVGAAILLVLACLFVFGGWSWRTVMDFKNAFDVGLRELEGQLNKKADRDEITAVIQQIFDEFIRQKLEPLLQSKFDEFKQLLVAEADDRRNRSQRDRGAGRAAPEAVNSGERDREPQDHVPSGFRPGGPPLPQSELRSWYDSAIRERGAAADFAKKLHVVGLVRLDGRSASGLALLAPARDPDLQKSPFWGIKAKAKEGNKESLAILPGRYQFERASAHAADGGRAGDRTFGQVFTIIDGTDYSLQEVAQACKTIAGFEEEYEVVHEGTLVLPRLRRS